MNASVLSPALPLTIAAIGCAVLVFVEARRRDSRHRVARIGATVAAVIALALLDLYRFSERREPNASVNEAVLWTQNAAATTPPNGTQFALPRAMNAPVTAIRVPDAAYIRREHPEIRTLRIVGDGLEPFELAALSGVELTFETPSQNQAKPGIGFIHYPRQLTIGEQLRLQGRIDPLPAGESVTVTVTVLGPAGERTEAIVRGEGGNPATFTVVAPAAKAEGRFRWRVSAVSSLGNTLLDETLGIAVVRPLLPRILALESSPRLDTTHLQRWFSEIGGIFVSRATVAQGRYRFTSSSENPAEFGAVDRELVKKFDLVLVDAAALSGLAAEEREAINLAVREDGLGLLVIASAELPLTFAAESLFPWKVEQMEEEMPAGELRMARLQWPGLATPIEHPVALENVRLTLAPGETPLLRDTQGRAIVVTRQQGRGTLAVSIARDTWRWRLQENTETFAAYWSHLSGAIAKPAAGQPQRWVIENPSNAPLTVNHPVGLRLVATEQPPTDVRITSEAGPERVMLSVANDPEGPQHWRGTFWPRRSGWHTVQLASDGARLDFYVHDAQAWAGLASPRRIAATQRAASRRPDNASAVAEQQESSSRVNIAPTIALYLVFLLASSYLWLERRKAAA